MVQDCDWISWRKGFKNMLAGIWIGFGRPDSIEFISIERKKAVIHCLPGGV
jgi:hypothetical protein